MGRHVLGNAAAGRGDYRQVDQQEQGERTKRPRTTLLETKPGEFCLAQIALPGRQRKKIMTWDTLYYGGVFELSSTTLNWPDIPSEIFVFLYGTGRLKSCPEPDTST
jgi:hypothetical protein